MAPMEDNIIVCALVVFAMCASLRVAVANDIYVDSFSISERNDATTPVTFERDQPHIFAIAAGGRFNPARVRGSQWAVGLHVFARDSMGRAVQGALDWGFVSSPEASCEGTVSSADGTAWDLGEAAVWMTVVGPRCAEVAELCLCVLPRDRGCDAAGASECTPACQSFVNSTAVGMKMIICKLPQTYIHVQFTVPNSRDTFYRSGQSTSVGIHIDVTNVGDKYIRTPSFDIAVVFGDQECASEGLGKVRVGPGGDLASSGTESFATVVDITLPSDSCDTASRLCLCVTPVPESEGGTFDVSDSVNIECLKFTAEQAGQKRCLSEIKVSSFTVISIEPEEYRVGEATTITYSAILYNRGPNPVVPAAGNINLVLVQLRMGGANGHIIGSADVDIATRWDAGEEYHVLPRVVTATLTRQACASNLTANLQLCAGVSFEESAPNYISSFTNESIHCIDFKEIEEGGAGIINCPTIGSPIPIYVIVLLLALCVCLVIIIICLYRKVRNKRPRQVPPDETDEPATSQRPRSISFAHIYEDVSTRLQHIRNPFRRAAGDGDDNENAYDSTIGGRKVNVAFQTDNESNDQNVTVATVHGEINDSADSTPASNLFAKRPSRPNVYIIEDASLIRQLSPRKGETTVIRIDGIPRLATTDQMEALDLRGNVIGLVDGSSHETASAELEPLELEQVNEEFNGHMKYSRSQSVDMPLRDAPDIPSDPDPESETDSIEEIDPYATSITNTDNLDINPVSADSDPDPDPHLGPDFEQAQLNPTVTPGLVSDPNPEPITSTSGFSDKPKTSPRPVPGLPSHFDERSHHSCYADSDQASRDSDSVLAPVPPRAKRGDSSAEGIPSTRAKEQPERDAREPTPPPPPKPRDTSRKGAENTREAKVPPRPQVPFKPRRLSNFDSGNDKNEDEVQDGGSSSTPSARPPVPAKSSQPRKPDSLKANNEDEVQDRSSSSTSSVRPEPSAKPRRPSKPDSWNENNEEWGQDFSSSSTSSAKGPPRQHLPAKPKQHSKSDPWKEKSEDRVQDRSGSSMSSARPLPPEPRREERNEDEVQDWSSSSTPSDRAHLPAKPNQPSQWDSWSEKSADGVQDWSSSSTPSDRAHLPPKPNQPSQSDSWSEKGEDRVQDRSTSSTSSARSQLPPKPRRPSQSDSWSEKNEDGVQDLSNSSTSSVRRQHVVKPKPPPLSIYNEQQVEIDRENISHTPSLTPKTPPMSHASSRQDSVHDKQVDVDKKIMDVAINKARISRIQAPNREQLVSPQDVSSDADDGEVLDQNQSDTEFMKAVLENYLALIHEMSTTDDDYEVAIKRQEDKFKGEKPAKEARTVRRRKSYTAQLLLKQRRKNIQSGEVYVNQWNKSWEINRDNLHMDRSESLGEGQFGKVYKATVSGVRNRPGNVLVAVKELKDGAGPDDKDEFLKELAIHTIMKPHPHVVELVGCCIRDEPICIITEYLSGGNLLWFLRKRPTRDTGPDLARHYFAKFGLHIARGMDYVSEMEIVHRDLAARNILISEEEVCKVADFGFARDIFGIDCYPRAPEKAPIRWYAPESILDNVFGTKSDVWSFGVLLFEIATLGRITPYKEHNNDEVRFQVSAGAHPTKPPHCDNQLCDILEKCWRKKAGDRPSFHELVEIFEDIQDQYPDPNQVTDEDPVLNSEDEESAF